MSTASIFAPFEQVILSAHDMLSHFIHNFNPTVVLRELQHEEEYESGVEEGVSTDEEDIEANLKGEDDALSSVTVHIESSSLSTT